MRYEEVARLDTVSTLLSSRLVGERSWLHHRRSQIGENEPCRCGIHLAGQQSKPIWGHHQRSADSEDRHTGNVKRVDEAVNLLYVQMTHSEVRSQMPLARSLSWPQSHESGISLLNEPTMVI